MPNNFKLSCVLFDLDGTLVDTAPDLFACLNESLKKHGFPVVSDAQLKPFISYGAVVLVEECLKDKASAEEKAGVVETLLNIYEQNIVRYSVFFDGMLDVLDRIEGQGLKWGIVTNKRQRFTNPLISALNLTKRAACVVSGDTTPNPKPHTDPMLEACKRAQVSVNECVYIGDAKHDIKAGRNAKMKTLVALYGYLSPGDKPEEWGADGLISSPQQLSTWITSILCH